MYFGQGYATATADLELTSLMLELRASLDRLVSGQSKVPDQVLERLKNELLAAKSFYEGVRSEGGSNANGAEMFSLLIGVENPPDWDAFRIVLEDRLRQIHSLSEGTAAVEELKAWTDNILQALQERSRAEEMRGRSWWSP